TLLRENSDLLMAGGLRYHDHRPGTWNIPGPSHPSGRVIGWHRSLNRHGRPGSSTWSREGRGEQAMALATSLIRGFPEDPSTRSKTGPGRDAELEEMLRCVARHLAIAASQLAGEAHDHPEKATRYRQ